MGELKSSKQIVIVGDIFRLHQTLTLFLVGYLFALLSPHLSLELISTTMKFVTAKQTLQAWITSRVRDLAVQLKQLVRLDHWASLFATYNTLLQFKLYRIVCSHIMESNILGIFHVSMNNG